MSIENDYPPPSVHIEDTFAALTNVNSMKYGKPEGMSDYDKNIILYAIKYCNSHMNSNNLYGVSKNIFEYNNTLFIKFPDITYDEMMIIYKVKSHECFLTYQVLAYSEKFAKLWGDICMINTRPIPLTDKTDWMDTNRLNRYGSIFNTIMWKNHDYEHTITVPINAKPINQSVELDFHRVLKIIIGPLRTFIITNNLFPENFKDGKWIITPGIRKLTPQEICDECYMNYCWNYGGAVACDVFELSEYSLSIKEIKSFLARYPSSAIGYILNTVTYKSGSGGQHWVSVTFTDNKAKLICSQQGNWDSFADNSRLHMTLNSHGFGIEHNQTLIQLDEVRCGIFSVLTLLAMIITNYSLYDAVQMVGVEAKNFKNGFDIEKITMKIVGVRP